MKHSRWIAGILMACTFIMGITIPAAAAAPMEFEAVPGFGADHSTEPDLYLPGIDGFQCPELTYYNHIIFVGDSRTYQLSLHVDDPRISFVSKSGMGLTWFKSTGYKELQTLLKGSAFATPLRSAIVLNLGVNDLYNQDQYLEYMNSIVPELINQNCDLYYMSLNPVDTDVAPGIRPVRDIKAFNTALRSELDRRYTYLDCYNYLEKSGFDTKDGLHYTSPTYSKIFRFAVDNLNAKRPVTSNVQWKKSGAYWYAVAPSSGKKYTNRWITTNKKKYYVGASGRLCVSQWIKTNGKYYYVQADGAMAVNTVVDGYTVDANGVRQ